MSRCSARYITATALAVLALAPGSAFAHGGEEEALENTPARTLAQQALALLSQEGSAVEAHERVEAALESEDREGVDEAKLRETQRAFEAGDHELAARLLDEALADKGSAEPSEEPAGAHDEMTEDGAQPSAGIEPQPSSFEHAREFEPDRGTPEWVGFALGLLAIAVAAAGLTRARRRRTA